MKKNFSLLIIMIATILSIAVFLSYEKWMKENDTALTATGTVEVTTADIRAKASGYLLNWSVKEGDKIVQGKIVANLQREDLEYQVEQNKHSLEKAIFQLRDLEKGSRRQEILEAQAKLNSAKNSYKRAQADFSRYKELFQTGAISKQQLDVAQEASDNAYNEQIALEETLSLLKEGNRIDQIQAQRQEVERARYALAASQALLDDVNILAPLSGTVAIKNYEDHEYVNAGTAIATIYDTEDCWVKIYINSTQIGMIKISQPAEISIDSFPGKVFTGTIKEIATEAEFTPHSTVTKNERAQQVVAVKVKIDNTDNVFKPGMPADVRIQPLQL